MAIVLPHTLQAGTPENVNDVQENLQAIEDALNALGGDLGGTIDDATVSDLAVGGDLSGTLSAARVAGIASTGFRYGTGGALGSATSLSSSHYVNYSPGTVASIDHTKPSWAINLDASNDRIGIFRAAATAGTPSFSLLGYIDSAGVLNGFTTGIEPAFSTYKTLLQRGPESFSAATTAGTYLFTSSDITAAGGSTGYLGPVYLDPADFSAGSRTTKYRVRANLITSETAPVLNLVAGLYPVTAVVSRVPTLGTVTSGSTVTFTAPGADSLNQGNSGDFTAPAAGYYALGFTTSANASGSFAVGARLQVRQV